MRGRAMASSNIKLSRYVLAFSIWGLLCGRMAYMHVRQHKLWNTIVSKYGKDPQKFPHLALDNVITFLHDSGVKVTKEQFKLWVGDIDDEHDGFDKEELLKTADFFEDFGGARGMLRELDDAEPWFGLSGFIDFILLVGALACVIWFIKNSAKMEKRLAANSFVSAVRMSRMKNKWQELDDSIQTYEREKSILQEKISKAAPIKLPGVDSKGAEQEMYAESQKELAKLKMDLQTVQAEQEKAIRDRDALRSDVEQHVQTAYRSTEKLQQMQSILYYMNKMGAFRGSGQGQYAGLGAQEGFAVSRIRSPNSTPKNTNDNTATACSGFGVNHFIFGYPEKTGEMSMFEVDTKRDLIGEGVDCAYKCKNVASGEEFCVKIYGINKQSNTKQIMNDLRTKQAIQDHPHIVKYKQVVETETNIFVLMELIPGQDLFGETLHSDGLTEPDAAGIFVQVCKALIFCHDKGVIHGDVKAENVMIVKTDKNKMFAKLIDFGFSCFLSTENDQESGSSNLEKHSSSYVFDSYTPPEALLEDEVTKDVDNFRLGCMLYVMLMAARPFAKSPKIDAAKRKRGEVIEYARWKELSSEVKDLIVRLLRDRLDLKEALEHPWVKANT